MSEWQEVRLGTIVASVSETFKFTDKQVVFLNTSDILADKFLHADLSDPKKLPGQAKKRIKKGDLLFSEIRPANKRYALVNFDADDYVVSTKLMVLRSKGNIDPTYLKLFLTSEETLDYLQMIAEDRSGTFPQITFDILDRMELMVPPLPEQKAIASVLSSLDDKIDLLHRQNTTLERMAETLFRQWFVEDAQEDWEEKPLDKLVTITSSKRVFYSEYVTSGVPFYRSKEIIELHNSGSTNSELFITESRFNEINDKFGAPQESDILLTSVGTLGIPYKVKKSDRFYFKDGNLTWFKDFTGVPSVIIYCWLKSNIGKEQLDSITIGSTQAALTISGLKQIVFKLPPKDVIKMAEEKLTAVYSKIEGNQKQIFTLEKLRDNLLPKLMSGEIRVEH